jgi:predicted permease
VAVLTLALCIGANTAIFSIINAVMLKSLPVRDPQHLMLFEWSARQSPKIHSSSSYGDCNTTNIGGANPHGCSLSKPFLDDVHGLGLFSGLAEFAGSGSITVSGKGVAHQANAQYVNGDYFRTLGVGAAAGRVFAPADDAPGAPAVVVLHHGYWLREFGSDPSAVGKTLHLNGLPFTIVGVAEERFAYLTPGNVRDLSIPMAQRRYLRTGWTAKQEDAGAWWIVTVGRLKPGVSPKSAQSQVSALFLNDLLHGDKPMAKAEDAPAITLAPSQTGLTGVRKQILPLLSALMLAVAIVLLIGCANVAGLLLARATARQREIAVRQALGAARGRLIRQLLTESVTLSTLGGGMGVLLAYWGARALLTFAANNAGRPLGFSAELDLPVLGFTFAAAILTGTLFGLAPALRSMRVDLTPALKAGSDGGRARQGPLRPGNLLVVAQVALTVVVLVAAGLLVHTLENLRNIDPGFAPQNLLTFSVDSTLTHYKGERLAAFYRNLQDRFSAVPGVLSASYSESPLLSGSLSDTSFHLPGTPPKARIQVDYMPVGPGFFETMKIPMIRGRRFKPEEYELAATVESDPKAEARIVVPAIVNESFVHAYFAKVDAIGQPFGADSPGISGDPDTDETAGWTIVGVVRDAKYNNLRRAIQPTMYVPGGGRGTFELRTARDPMSVMPDVHEAIRQIGADLPIVDIRTQTERIEQMLFQERLIARLASLFGLLALLLACIGLYGLLAFEVTRGTREIGIRMALGAQSRQVLRSVVRHGIALAITGAAIGIAVSLAVTRFLSSMLYEVKPGDPLTLIGVLVLLLVVALVACYIPARRATRVNPLVALRHE